MAAVVNGLRLIRNQKMVRGFDDRQCHNLMSPGGVHNQMTLRK